MSEMSWGSIACVHLGREPESKVWRRESLESLSVVERRCALVRGWTDEVELMSDRQAVGWLKPGDCFWTHPRLWMVLEANRDISSVLAVRVEGQVKVFNRVSQVWRVDRADFDRLEAAWDKAAAIVDADYAAGLVSSAASEKLADAARRSSFSAEAFAEAVRAMARK